jgi:hypothetical protein
MAGRPTMRRAQVGGVSKRATVGRPDTPCRKTRSALQVLVSREVFKNPFVQG